MRAHILLTTALVAWLVGPTTAATFTVTNTGNAGGGSLRQAILAANVRPGADTITFNIPFSDPNFSGGVFTIAPTSALPELLPGGSGEGNGTVIAGASQTAFGGDTNPAGPEIQISGNALPAGTDGLTILAADCTVSGLAIKRCPRAGISIQSVNAQHNTVAGCYIGTDATGTLTGFGNGLGVEITAGADANFVGDTSATQRNVISSNIGAGVAISGTGTTGNKVQGNYIGIKTGSGGPLGNGDGVTIMGGASANVIGGQTKEARNVISSNFGDGVRLEGSGTGGNQVRGNYIGTNKNGAGALGNYSDGVEVSNGAGTSTAPNIVGGTTTATRNILSGSNSGVRLFNADSNQVQCNLIQNNDIGVVIDGGNHNTIGGAGAPSTAGPGGAGNLIAGNFHYGVQLLSANFNRVQGNFIGTDAAGASAVGNGTFGVLVMGGDNNFIGGTATALRNVISGNGADNSETGGIFLAGNDNRVQGNFIGTNRDGTAALPNTGIGVVVLDHDNLIGGTTASARNVISGNQGVGILLRDSNTHSNKVQGNYIGTNAAGTAAVPNGGGVSISGAQSNLIGGVVGGGNLIAGNTAGGVRLFGATGNVVQGNFIGTDKTGAAGLPNFLGVQIDGGAQNNLIGGVGAGNVIAGHTSHGVQIAGVNTKNNRVEGNLIGLNAAGSAALGNGGNGVLLTGDTANSIGGIAPGAGNVISGNALHGVVLSGTGAIANLVQSNYIGTDKSGTAAVPNKGSGVRLEAGAKANRIGVVNGGNVIAGNGDNGVVINGAGSDGNILRSNLIGTDATGAAALPNAAFGVRIGTGAKNNIIGEALVGNRIATNGQDGVRVNDTASTGNRISGNAIYRNGGLGINLRPDGEAPNTVTPNDPADADSGPNHLQNFPDIASVTVSGGHTTLSGLLRSTPHTTFVLDFFRSTASVGADPSGFGEGQKYIGSLDVTTNANGIVAFSFSVGGDFSGQLFTATATRANTGDTSEFSKAAVAGAAASD